MNMKCFWLGHGDKAIRKSYPYYTYCTVCGTEDCYGDTPGEIILEALRKTAWGIGIFLACCLAISALTLVLFALAVPIFYKSCQQFATMNNIPYVYKFWYGCLVQYNGHWVSPDALIQLLR